MNGKKVTYSKDALRVLIRMPVNAAKLVRSKVEQYAKAPETLANNVKALRGEIGIVRLRIGDWRVLFTDEGDVIAIIRIAPRGGAYD